MRRLDDGPTPRKRRNLEALRRVENGTSPESTHLLAQTAKFCRAMLSF